MSYKDESKEDVVVCGNIVECKGIRSVLGPFRILPDYKIIYPEVVIKALCNLYNEYNQAFAPLVAANREWETDYNLCMLDGFPVNWCVQIDMVGLQKRDLEKLAGMPEIEVRKILRKRIFEIENSIAMYQLLEKMFAGNGNGSNSYFKTRFCAVLDHIRQRFGRPIALLAVTEEKYEAMLASEFGKHSGDRITDQEVKDLSGFDAFFGPQQFREYLAANNGQCEHLLYIRSSDPISKLKNPALKINHTLFSDSDVRQMVKANALTFNVDAPEMEYVKRINDTKDYMNQMAMAFPIASLDDLGSDEFRGYLTVQGIDPVDVISGKAAIRCKPAKCTYGCYGHVSGVLTDRKFRKELEKNLYLRGYYIVQPEMVTPIVVSSSEDIKYTFIDRNFFGIINGKPVFLGGFRNLMSLDSTEAKNGRIHGNKGAVWAEIIA